MKISLIYDVRLAKTYMHFLLSHVNFLSLSFLDEGHHPCFIVFDILIINEKKLANVPLRERIKSMEE